jgi:uncharacterized protein YceH (UPF0502 family)
MSLNFACVLASLVEKQLATPDYYPMTINALTNACNQKSHRDPVVAYDESTVQRALDSLRAKHLVYTFHGSESRTIKYGHLFPKGYELNDGETVIMCVLILRGPPDSGELRSRSRSSAPVRESGAGSKRCSTIFGVAAVAAGGAASATPERA